MSAVSAGAATRRKQDKYTDTGRHAATHRQTQANTDRHTDAHRHTQTQRHRPTHRHTDTHRDTDTHKHTQSHTAPQAHTYTRTHTCTDSHTQRHRHTQTHTNTYTHTAAMRALDLLGSPAGAFGRVSSRGVRPQRLQHPVVGVCGKRQMRCPRLVWHRHAGAGLFLLVPSFLARLEALTEALELSQVPLPNSPLPNSPLPEPLPAPLSWSR